MPATRRYSPSVAPITIIGTAGTPGHSVFVADLIATQAEDGYLGPFPESQRLLGNWDLWGHYHVMQALLLWHQQTGDVSALRACRRAADLICQTYLDQPRRVFDAGSRLENNTVG